ncbi:MAG: phage holin family protein [Burkholderiales bacterium]|nr:phage holin family protein [Burkholderiales bacterium]
MLDRLRECEVEALKPGGTVAHEDGSLRTALRGAWSELRCVVREHAFLAVLEAQRAGLHLTYALASVLVVSVLLVTAWLAVVTAAVIWLTAHVTWPVILLVAAILNLVGAALVAWWAKRQLTEMPFSATLRQLAAGREEITTTGIADAKHS